MNEQEMSNMVFCQSCGMPLQKQEDYGSNADGSKNTDYCTYCYQKGTFTVPDVSLEEMIDKCSNIMAEMNIMPFEDAKAMNMKFLPQLKRWRK